MVQTRVESELSPWTQILAESQLQASLSHSGAYLSGRFPLPHHPQNKAYSRNRKPLGRSVAALHTPLFFHVGTESRVEVERASASFSSEHHRPELWEQRQKEAWALRRWQLVTVLHSNIVPESAAICQPVWFKTYTRVFSSVWRVSCSVNVIYV